MSSFTTLPFFKFARDPEGSLAFKEPGPVIVHRVGRPIFYALTPELHEALMAYIDDLLDERDAAIALARWKGEAETVEVDLHDL